MEFFERVKAEAKARGTTIEYLAEKAGLTRGAYNTYRRRGLLPRADEAVKIASELDLSVEYLVTGKASSSFIPLRVHSIVEDLCLIDEEADLAPIRTLAKVAADKHRAEARATGGG